MEESNYHSATKVTSFGLESLFWNVPNEIYSKYMILKYEFDELVKYLRSDFSSFEWYKEANGIKTLFPTTLDRENYTTFINDLSSFYQYDI